MLLRQNGSRDENRRLLAAHHRFERGAQGNFGFSVANIAAEQSIHRTRAFHVAFNVDNGFSLVVGFYIGETVFEFTLPLRIRRERKSHHHLTTGIQIEQVLGNLLHRFLHPLLGFAPALPAEMVEGGLAAVRADVTGESIRLMDGDKQRVGIVVLDGEKLPLVTLQLSLDQACKTPDAVVHMNHVIADQQIGIQRFGGLGGLLLTDSRLRAFPAEDFRVSN